METCEQTHVSRRGQLFAASAVNMYLQRVRRSPLWQVQGHNEKARDVQASAKHSTMQSHPKDRGNTMLVAYAHNVLPDFVLVQCCAAFLCNYQRVTARDLGFRRRRFVLVAVRNSVE